ncbi:MAG TPA: ribosome small subunit-dependent GTPase A [Rubrivivax sp.]
MIDSTSLARLRAIGLTQPVLQQLAQQVPPDDNAELRRVVDVQRENVVLHDGDNETAARVLPALRTELQAQSDALAVGDWVLAAPNEWGQWWVHRRLPPLTQIARRLHDGRDKIARAVIVSNVDTALLTMGLDHDFSLRRLERYLTLARLAHVSAVVVLTKLDLCDQVGRRLREVQAMLPADTPAVAVNGLSAGAVPVLEPWLGAGQTLVLIGSSGAGKSTLTNTLMGAEVQATGGTRTGDGRGRHTTTSRTLHRTPHGACIIDTPGLRTLRLDTDEAALGQVFDDVAQMALQCRFRDCRHDDEPGCAVREAVPAERLRSFQKLRREARRDTMSLLERQQQLSEWKARGRASKERLKEKGR